MFKRETCMDARWIKCSVLDCSVDTGLHVDIFNTGFYYIVDSLQENGFGEFKKYVNQSKTTIRTQDCLSERLFCFQCVLSAPS